MITYDKYYQTPRIWLLGYDEVCEYVNDQKIVNVADTCTERDAISARTNLPGCDSRTCLQNCYDRSFPPFHISPSRVCPPLQTRKRDAKAHRAHECGRRRRAEIAT